MRIKLIIEYNGIWFCGWQRQADCKEHPSIQETVEAAISRVFGGDIAIQLFCSGRTDSGVHALGQVAHFDICDTFLENRWSCNIRSMPKAINYHLGTNAIAVKDASIVDDNFHARFSAKMRHYQYKIYNSYVDTVFMKDRAWHVHKALDIPKMLAGAQNFIGKHDFTSFCSSQSNDKNMVRTISRINITRNQDDMITIDVSAKSFLHNQVRITVGTLVDLGLGKIHPEDITNIIAARDRRKASQTAPAYGLYFMNVEY